jgi:hypothetical protein
MQLTKTIIEELSSDNYLKQPKATPHIYDDGRKFGVRGRTSANEHYDVKFMGGRDSLYDPSRYGETQQSLLNKIQDASERSTQNVKSGFGNTVGVIVDDGSTYVSPLPGVEVVHISKNPLDF